VFSGSHTGKKKQVPHAVGKRGRSGRHSQESCESHRGGLERAQQAREASERESYHVEVTPLDTSDEFSGAALNGVGAGFADGFAGGHVRGDFARGEPSEGDPGGFDGGEEAHATTARREAQERDGREDAVRAAGKKAEHAAGVGEGGRLAENFAAEDDHGVRAEDDGGAANMASGGESLGAGEAGSVARGGFAFARRFVHGCGKDAEGNARAAQDFRAAGRGGGEDEAGMM